jgi:hypothetical protein
LRRVDVKALVRDERHLIPPNVAAKASSTISARLWATLLAMAIASTEEAAAVLLLPAEMPPRAGMPRESVQV